MRNMADIMFMAIIHGQAFAAHLRDVPLNWEPLDTRTERVKTDELPDYLFEIDIGNEKGGFRQTFPKPDPFDSE